MTKLKRKVAVIDFETDPFKVDRVPEPFCVEFYSDDICVWFWGPDCAQQLIQYMLSLDEPFLIYAHNGGKFDFHFLFDAIDNPALIIKGRIVECKLGIHTLRDSYAIIPVPLHDYEKMEFDYDKMESEVRETNKNQILEYLHSDCVNLYNLVSNFNERFGPRLTIGGTAMREIRKMHPFASNGSRHDKEFRKYYYGGRVQCFKSGLIEGPFKLFDVNSMYMSAMKHSRHPINGAFATQKTLPDSFDDPFFIHFAGTNLGAIPHINENNKLVFDKEYGDFYCCSHELQVALEYELVEIEHIHSCYIATETTTFAEFVDMCNDQKAAAKGVDPINYLFAKLLGNSGYGRFGINPENFEDWIIHRDFGDEDDLRAEGYEIQVDYEDLELWSKKADISEDQYCDVAIAASITSASRAILLRGLQSAVDPVYCDTDSIICRDFTGDIHPTKLGAWDLEKESAHVAIAGKKMFAMYDSSKDKKAKKLSSKGGTITLPEMIEMCKGATIRHEKAAPSFSLKRPPIFVKRNFRITA